MHRLPFQQGSLLFAPMEGVTDEVYRKVLLQLFDEWDYYFTDFLRIPGEGKLTPKKALNHYGQSLYRGQSEKAKAHPKMGYQILAGTNSDPSQASSIINDLGFTHLDLNLGCPSKKVNQSKGGAYLLSDLKLLEQIILPIRKSFTGTLTAKIRTGFHDTILFDDIIYLLNEVGVEAITVHGRTRDQLYKGVANWDYIARAVEISDVPIIGNGDVWIPQDIKKLFSYTQCHSVMCARGALKTPWLARLYKENHYDSQSEVELLEERKNMITDYYNALDKEYRQHGAFESFRLSRFKGLTRYLFDDFECGESFRSKLLRAQKLSDFFSELENIGRLY